MIECKHLTKNKVNNLINRSIIHLNSLINIEILSNKMFLNA